MSEDTGTEPQPGWDIPHQGWTRSEELARRLGISEHQIQSDQTGRFERLEVTPEIRTAFEAMGLSTARRRTVLWRDVGEPEAPAQADLPAEDLTVTTDHAGWRGVRNRYREAVYFVLSGRAEEHRHRAARAVERGCPQIHETNLAAAEAIEVAIAHLRGS